MGIMRHSNSRRLCAALVFSVGLGLLTGCTHAPVKPAGTKPGDYAYVKQYISWMAPRLLRRHKTPGMSIVLVDDQEVVWAQGFGYADLERETPATPESVYRIGSITKLFTASAAMKLAEDGRIDIDAPIRRYLPEFSIHNRFSDAGPVTARNIMTHHSGLPADILKGMWTRNGEQRYTDAVRQLKAEYTAYPPNYIYSYSNIALSVLGHMVARVSGRPFETYLQEQIFGPLGMDHTGFRLDPAMRAQLAKGYNGRREIEPGTLRDLPAGGLYSSVMDLSRFLRAVFAADRPGGPQVLRAGTLAEMMRRQNTGVPLDFNFDIGLGWFLVDHGIRGMSTVASHGGGTPCYFSQLIALPEVKLGVAVLANSCSSGPVVADTAVTALKLAVEAKTGIPQNLDDTVPKAPVVERPPDELLDRFVGRYATWLGLVEVQREGRRLRAALSGWKFDLVPHEDGRFSIRFRLFGLIPIRHLFGVDLDSVLLKRVKVQGRDVVVMNFKGRDQVFGEKVHPEPIPEIWLARLGAMEIINQDEYMRFRDNRLINDNGILVMRYRLKMPVMPEQKAALPIRPISDDEAIVLGLGRGMGETIKVVEVGGGEEALYFSGYEARWTSYDTPDARARIAALRQRARPPRHVAEGVETLIRN